MDKLREIIRPIVKIDKLHIDNIVFKLHYRFTAPLLLFFSLLLTSKQHFGDPINCDTKENAELMDNYCWIYGIYIVKKAIPDVELPGLGLDLLYTPPWIDRLNLNSKKGDRIIWQKHYQWIGLVFFLQALLFYLPRFLWKCWEGNRLDLLLKDLTGPLLNTNWNLTTKNKLINYLMSGRDSHNLYAFRYAFCEILNFVNVTFQIYLMDWFLTGEFCFFGLALSSLHNTNLLDEVFPKLAKCKYFKYGPSGTIESRDSLCVLPLNILNEKLFLFLWIWFGILFLVTMLDLIWKAMIILFPRIRIYLLISQTRFIKHKQAKMIVNELGYGDFFLLYNIGRNVNPILYKELIFGIHGYMTKKDIIDDDNTHNDHV